MRSIREIWKFAFSKKKPLTSPKFNLPRTKKKYTHISSRMIKDARKMHKLGYKNKEISEQLNIGSGTVSDIINHKGAYKRSYQVKSKPFNQKKVFEDHQEKIRNGQTRFLPNHSLCPVCNPNSYLTWPEYYKMVHKSTVRHARKQYPQGDFSISNY